MRLCLTVFPLTLADTDRALVHAAVMLDNDVQKVASLDLGFDGVEGIERLPLD